MTVKGQPQQNFLLFFRPLPSKLTSKLLTREGTSLIHVCCRNVVLVLTLFQKSIFCHKTLYMQTYFLSTNEARVGFVETYILDKT